MEQGASCLFLEGLGHPVSVTPMFWGRCVLGVDSALLPLWWNGLVHAEVAPTPRQLSSQAPRGNSVVSWRHNEEGTG